MNMQVSKSKSPNTSPDAFDFRRIRRLVELMEDHGLTEIEIRQGDARVRLRKSGSQSKQKGSSEAAASVPAMEPQRVVPVASESPALPENVPDDTGRFVEITSPMVGTYYAASAPDAEPYVEVGTQVNLEMTVCVIEAMKVFNEIPSEVSGTIAAILVENGDAIEFGQPLFRVEIDAHPPEVQRASREYPGTVAVPAHLKCW